MLDLPLFRMSACHFGPHKTLPACDSELQKHYSAIRMGKPPLFPSKADKNFILTSSRGDTAPSQHRQQAIRIWQESLKAKSHSRF